MPTIRIGIDDTDSNEGMCTTYIGAVICDKLKNHGFNLKPYPKLVRLNPNWPLKTRGNCAISIEVAHNLSRYGELKEIVLKTVEQLAELKHDSTNPGVVFYLGKSIPNELQDFSKKVIQDIVRIEDAEKLAKKIGVEYHKFKLGRGIIGALAAIGESLELDSTYELLAYRNKSYRGTKRNVDINSVIEMDRKTYPRTFDNIDPKTGEIRITPHTPCPILFGIRSQDPESTLEALSIIKSNEPIERLIIYKSNQATDAHLISTKIKDLRPLKSAIISGKVSETPRTITGGHIILSLSDNTGEINCAAYEPTRDFRKIIINLMVGDQVRVYGAVKKKKNIPLTLNLEKIEVHSLAEFYIKRNPICTKCSKRAKSKGKGQGYRCEKCGKNFSPGSEKYVRKLRDLRIGSYEVPPRARRHLAKPLIRFSPTK
ncbi:TiaS agmantine-binding domain-containing protein [[Eubacterium] cellulosolvens]